ncbi:MAG: Hypothetical protein BHV28_04900 [Candidatus Tokpelaia hoelldobleri]|uniref:Uncharacterized protein n=1 Tax=Candidatus Tokpelaia hoelldobleri TaxID=1902579 RepID=A0A1U9JTL6_9HYPH|nr:MAG: Hypothetical protein BHV28_04900 [Candidatus Tokpelaia hoelldoblerii]
MPKLEQAIRHAFSKIDANDPAKRHQIYDAIWQMQEKTLTAEAKPDKQAIQEKRARLSHIIKKIEAEFQQFAPAVNDRLDSVSPARERTNHRAASSGPEEEAGPMVNRHKKHRRSPLRLLAILLIILLVTGFIAWAFFYSLIGGFSPTPDRPVSAPSYQDSLNPPGWTRVFNPADPAGLTTTGNATAQLHNEEGADFIRIHGKTAKDVTIIEIGPGALMALRGKTATINIIARGLSKNGTPASIICDFGNDEVNGHYRFNVSAARNNLLLEVNVPQTVNAPARLYISTNSADKNAGIDIFSVLIQAVE